MSRISVVIGDFDEGYVENLSNFLMTKYSGRFQINSFTKQEHLADFFARNSRKADILLADPRFCTEGMCMEKVNTLLYLSETDSSQKFRGYDCVYKYQSGDNLAGAIIKIFSQHNDNEFLSIKGNRKTLLAAVYSPAGGVGKTSIAVGSSIICARENLSVFYLNFEDIPSTGFFFNGNSDSNLSNVIFELKERKPNISFKIEGIKSIDEKYGIHFFNSPDSIRELDGIEGEEVQFLINQFTAAGQYDVIFADMSSGFNCRNRVLLEACDVVILALGHDEYSVHKAREFEREMDIVLQNEESTIPGKINLLVNMYKNHISYDMNAVSIFDKGISVVLPLVEELEVYNNMDDAVNSDCTFGAGLKQLLENIGIL